MAMWACADALADEAMKRMQERGILPMTPDGAITDEALANAAIREALKMALGPSILSDKLAAARLVLTYTKSKPPTVAHTRALIGRHGHHDQPGLLRAMMEANTAGEAASTSDGP
jgi:hypothetical protein